jgi:hypothetical protein
VASLPDKDAGRALVEAANEFLRETSAHAALVTAEVEKQL